MSQAIQIHQNHQPAIPGWVVLAQSACFAILYAVWMLPKTIFLRNTCLGIGAALSLFVIYRYRKYFLNKFALPAYLLIGLFLWLIFHLLFLSNDYPAQYKELTSVWKNCVIAIIFGLGFGISLSSLLNHSFANRNPPKVNSKISLIVWIVVWLGLIAPELIFIIKWILTNKGSAWGITAPDSWKLWPGSAPYYVAKIDYVCFCLPVLAIALGQIKVQIDQERILSWANGFYICVVGSVLFVFAKWQVFNGFIYALLITAILAGVLVWRYFKKASSGKQFIAIIFICALAASLVYQIKTDSHFETFVADAKVALDGEKYPQWKYDGTQGYPNNELGRQVYPSNYERVSWFVHGVELIPRYPQGYGLLHRSFGRLVKMDYPDSKMHQSHSGWLDLTLGIGIVGVALILGAMLLAMRNCSRLQIHALMPEKDALNRNAYLNVAWWALLGLGLIWCTTEISQKVNMEALLFWVALATGMSMGASRSISSREKSQKAIPN
ncbi:hypothetical protein G6722_06620 [Polynucleobacter paneuropaeus]|nr:hypothetical protein [Polynucleobacter paneuropaeus]